jgi:hypothetical protein
MPPKAKPRSAIGSFWDALSPLSKAATVMLPILAVLAILAPFAASTIGTPPYAHRSVENRIVVVEQRIDLQERIALQREILKLEDESRRRRLSESEQNYLRDLKNRLKELEQRK